MIFAKSHLSKGNLQSRLNSMCRGGIIQNKLLSELTTWQIGGPADYIITPSRISEIQTIVPMLRDENVPFIVIGTGSNLLFSDSGFRGVIINIGKQLSKFQVKGQHVTAQAGIWTPYFSRMAAKSNLSGAEHIIGIPGNIGGLICMNGGSNRQSIGANIIRVTSINIDGQVIERERRACEFGYRSSCYQNNHEIIVEAEFVFQQGNYHESRKQMLDILASRKDKFPLKSNSCGSVFLSTPNIYKQYGSPGKIIEEMGLKGKRIGGARVSEKHANFIIHDGEATANDVLSLVHYIRQEVEKCYQVRLECEARYVSQSGKVQPLHLVRPSRKSEI